MHGPYDQVNALVLGAGASGEAAARLLAARGGHVQVLDEGDGVACADAAGRLRDAGITVRFGAGELPDGPSDVCVTSPGFAMRHPWIAACRVRGIPVISELELGACYWPGRILAVTGSKGKSSLVKLCADTFNGAGVTASPAGNYGIPLSRLALERPELRWAVTEVSSFQMEHTRTFSPDLAVLLNLQADHLDRHADMAEYKALKLAVFAAMRPGGVALLPAGLWHEGRIPEGVKLLRFGTDAACDWTYEDHIVTGTFEGRVCKVGLRGSWFDNPVLGVAAAAGVAALLHAGLDGEQIAAGLAGFEPLAHRMQTVAVSSRGVRYVDDSKATSLSATAAALRMAQGPVRLIAGGLLKEKELGWVKELLTQTTKKVYLIGQSAEQMFQAWSTSVPCEVCGTLDQAVDAAQREALPGEIVLLSPGTASFDQFTSYRERGERFTERVRAVADLDVRFFSEGKKDKETQ
ncbi:MAG TPA: UDP-N-acetylmuramoyl-L-alanine--D-glutamate ligase [Kiritimatiellia bacterium]|mgnify:CR=1 FL=1|nr:UDP-N-acetylmuramoyl-L-alanine--D-glutamate ligase [Kiritimatiellia bacterium]HRU69448.1 UDP-N-acetylmuramoyl-L-alanine--D-glutamate ligase [Kiritimatiellia bacterium]